ncbi:MAG TPA: ATP-binding cassette domain-containing protein [Chloroflexota bacterium]|nr:ATP-binding cassette domain-containing protein [Chloroflexota bacterium]
MPAICVENVSKVFKITDKQSGLAGTIKALVRPRQRDKIAVDGISFIVHPGEMVGYIGVNGAGKSTTIKMLTGILVPSSGRIRVLDRDPSRQRVANAREIGVVFGQRSQLWWDLPFIDSLNLIGKIYEVEPSRYRRLMAEFVELLELDDLLHASIRTMSLGQKMRAELAATLIHEPRIIYLDEPTIGLDLVVKERIREVIRNRNERHGTTVILTTHDLGDIEQLCRRVMIIDAGRLIYDGPLETIRERFGTHRILTVDTAHDAVPITPPAGAELLSAGGRSLVLRFDRRKTTASRVTAELMAHMEVVDFSLTEPDLTSIVRQIYAGALQHDVPT